MSNRTKRCFYIQPINDVQKIEQKLRKNVQFFQNIMKKKLRKNCEKISKYCAKELTKIAQKNCTKIIVKKVVQKIGQTIA